MLNQLIWQPYFIIENYVVQKKTVLLCWYEVDKRPELLAPFIDMQDSVEFIQLYYHKKEDRVNPSSPFQMIYWSDYSTPFEILKEVKPDLVIGITESLHIISLIRACKIKDIKYFGLQHGFVSQNISDVLVTISRKESFSLGKVKGYLKKSLFYFSSFSPFKITEFLEGCKLYYSFFRLNVIQAIKDNQYAWLVPPYYICFSEYASQYYRQLYNIKPGQFLYTGVICFDDLFRANATTQLPGKSHEKYYLLIDTNFEEHNRPITKEQVSRCYYELLAFCKKENAKLKIKLHPWSYKYTDQPADPDIEFFKQLSPQELNQLILNSEGCFGFYSTLSFAVVAVKQLIQIKYDNIYIEHLEEKQITPVIDFYTFTRDDIHFNDEDLNHSHMINELLYKTDGNASARLKEIIVSA